MDRSAKAIGRQGEQRTRPEEGHDVGSSHREAAEGRARVEVGRDGLPTAAPKQPVWRRNA